MDVTARVAALEEEVSILKGEIKTILQELRIAVLARENPFSVNGHDFVAAMPSRQESTAFDAVFTEPPSIAPAPQPVVMIREVPSPIESASEAIASFVPAAASTKHKHSHQVTLEDEEPGPEISPRPRRWSVHSLAALMAWTQEHSQRFSHQDMDIVLSLAQYGGLVDEDLQSTLEKLAKGLAPEEIPLRASSTDFLLALRQLDALLDAATATAEPPARRAS